MFAKAGITAAPKTWAELETAAMKIKETSGVAGYGLPLGTEEAQVESSLWLWGAGGDWAQGGKLVANQPKAVEAFAEMKKLIDAGVVQADPGASNRAAVVDLFKNGKLGMYVGHSGHTAELTSKFPAIKFALAPMPGKDGQPLAFGVTDSGGGRRRLRRGVAATIRRPVPAGGRRRPHRGVPALAAGVRAGVAHCPRWGGAWASARGARGRPPRVQDGRVSIAGSIAASRSWRDGVLIDADVTREELAAATQDPGTLVWVDLLDPTPEDLAEIARELGLPPTAVEDALAPHERPKLIRHDSHLFFTVYGVELGEAQGGVGRLRTRRISGMVLPAALVTIRLDDEFPLAPVVARWEENAHLLGAGPGALVHGLLDVVVDGHFDAIQQLDDVMEGLEDQLFEERRTGQAFARSVYELRKDLVALRRVVLPMREVVNGLMRHPASEGVLRAWYDDLYDHVLRASEWTESLRDMVASIFETNLSLQDSRLNTIMKKLAGWAAIIAVPTAITGWFGQNVPYWGFSDPVGVWLSTGLIVGCVAILYAVFKAQDWL